MRALTAPLVLLVAVLLPSAGHAGGVLDRVKAAGVVRCGAEFDPGLVSIEPDGRPAGLLLDFCRAIGAAVLGPEGRFEFYRYDSSKAYDAVRNNEHDVFFLGTSELIEEELAGKVVPGPTVFYQTTSVMVSESSAIRHLEDLAGQSVCFPTLGHVSRHLEAWFAAHHLDFVRMSYQEEVEMIDTYNVQVCKALAGEITSLAEVRLDGGVNDLKSRILPEPVAAFPIMAATGTQDAEWSAIVAWSVHTVMRAETPRSDWVAGGAASLPVAAPELQLPSDWQKRVIAAVGTYGDIYRRNLGEDSPYHLPRGLNAPWQQGGIILAPYAE